ncbi:MAG: hypothetical protein IJQ43_08830 [Oscillospiraceae bacterium]|nr:hypothetical protein [Oscillospiraceae bacterium]
MKKLICLTLTLCMLFALAACGAAAPAEEPAAEWSREGYFADEEGNFLSVTRMDDVVEPGWYVGFSNGEDLILDSYGGILPQEGNSLRGSLPSGGDNPALTVTVSEEGEDGLLLAIEGGESYHFKPMDMPAADHAVSINTEGPGQIAYARTEEELSFEGYFTSSYFPLWEPGSYVLGARTDEEGWAFIKWTKDGEDFSTDPIITVELNDDAAFVAVFDYVGADGQNPVMNFIGDYQCDRARAHVECLGDDAAHITIDWGSSAWEHAHWEITGPLDTETLSISYSGCVKTIVVYDDNGELKSEDVEYEDGSGTVTFGEGLSFTWHEDRAEREDMVFEWVPVTEERSGFEGLWAEEIAGRCQIRFSYRSEGSMNVEIAWSGSAFERACWEMTADIYKDDIMIYKDAHSWVETYTDETTCTVSEEEFNGTGSFYLLDGKLHWVNDKTSEDTVFIPA